MTITSPPARPRRESGCSSPHCYWQQLVPAAIAFAPLAEAASTAPACFFSGNASVCQTEGNAQVSALPPTVDYQAQYPFFGYGGLLFHHRGWH